MTFREKVAALVRDPDVEYCQECAVGKRLLALLEEPEGEAPSAAAPPPPVCPGSNQPCQAPYSTTMDVRCGICQRQVTSYWGGTGYLLGLHAWAPESAATPAPLGDDERFLLTGNPHGSPTPTTAAGPRAEMTPEQRTVLLEELEKYRAQVVEECAKELDLQTAIYDRRSPQAAALAMATRRVRALAQRSGGGGA